jgi:uncharacterized protein (UPF0332 family)
MTKTRGKLEARYGGCERKFVKVDNLLYRDYQNAAYEDLDSARKEENPKWAVTKAYQALFMMCNSILVRKEGFYSKDHGCLIVALLHKNLVTRESLGRIHKMLEEKKRLFSALSLEDSFSEEITSIRLARNRYLYLPKSLRKAAAPAKQIIEEAAELIRILGEMP